MGNGQTLVIINWNTTGLRYPDFKPPPCEWPFSAPTMIMSRLQGGHRLMSTPDEQRKHFCEFNPTDAAPLPLKNPSEGFPSPGIYP